MQDDGNLVLYPVNTGDNLGDAYWSANTTGHGFKFHLYLNNTGRLLIINDTSSDTVQTLYENGASLAPNNSTIYRSTLDSDGIFHLYSHAYDASGDCNVLTLWEAFTNHCDVITFCGINSYCTLNGNQAYCFCFPGTEFVDPRDWSLGCERNFSEAICEGGKENEALYCIQTMDNVTWGDRPYFQAPMLQRKNAAGLVWKTVIVGQHYSRVSLARNKVFCSNM